MKNISLILFSIGALFFVSCTSNSEGEIQNAGYYSGKIPCTGCKDGAVDMLLRENGDFLLQVRKFKDEKSEFVMEGSWSSESDEVNLKTEEESLVFNIKERTLKSVEGHSIKMRKLGFIRDVDNDRIESVIFKGNVIYAKGENWNLDITATGEIVFEVQGEEFVFMANPFYISQETNSTIWEASNTDDSISISLGNVPCESDDFLGKSITITLNGISFPGCAVEPKSSFVLNDTWNLISMNGEDLPDVQFPKGRPLIDINSIDGSFVGKSGCNFWRGGIVFSGDKVQIRPGVMTRMACPNMEFENAFTQSIGRAWNYELEGKQLVFSDGDDEMVWMKN